MKKKLDIGLGLSDAFVHLVKSSGKFMINFLVSLGLGLLSALLAYFKVFDKFTDMTYYKDLSILETALGDMVKMIPLFIVITLFGIGVQGVFVKITDDVIEKRELTYGQQFTFVFKRLGKIILANLLAIVPLILIYLLMFAAVLTSVFTAMMPVLMMTVLTMVYVLMLTFIDQIILTEDVSALQAIKNSVAVVSHNFFRLMFTFIALAIFSYTVAMVFAQNGFIFELIHLLINVVISLYMVVFVTTLYKQTRDIKEKEAVIEYFENYE